MKKQSIYKIILSLLLSITILGCHPRKHQKEKQLFRYNEAAGLVNLDPAFARDQSHTWVCNQLYDGLVQLNDSLKVLPAIAHSWEISPDGLDYTFHLRKDVLFHEDPVFENKTRNVTARDVAYSLKCLLDPETASPGEWVLSIV